MSMHEIGELNRLMNKENTILRESIFRFLIRDKGVNISIRVWKDELLVATERDVQESYETLQQRIFDISKDVGNNGREIAFKILALSNVNAVEVYTESDIGIVLYKNWP